MALLCMSRAKTDLTIPRIAAVRREPWSCRLDSACKQNCGGGFLTQSRVKHQDV
jgi:hypothetical protein